MDQSTERLKRAREGKRESKTLEFKAEFDPGSPPEAIELVKDLVAIANTGGGVVVVGAKSNGRPSGKDVSKVLELDPADLTNRIFSYTGTHFSGFTIHEITRSRRRMAAILIDPVSDTPLVFEKPGTYAISAKRQTSAFAQGSVYFRHGAKSEPATQADLREFVERRVAAIRDSWLKGIRQVVAAPGDTEVALIQRTTAGDAGSANIRVTTDPGAPVYGMLSPDDSHPYRQKELLEEINERLPAKARKLTSHDIQCVRRVHDISPATAPEFMHQAKHALSPQYSSAFIDWLLAERKKDRAFFKKARQLDRERG
jgi:hypothetical protein